MFSFNKLSEINSGVPRLGFPADRPLSILEQDYPAAPLPPLNLFAMSAMTKGTIDLRWSNPAELVANTKFNILGVNIYRSFDSEFGPFFRLNATPVGSAFWRDKSTLTVSLQEDVSNNFTNIGPIPPGLSGPSPETGPSGDGTVSPGGIWTFRTAHKPIVISPPEGEADCTNLNVQVTVNGQNAFVDSIDAPNGIVRLVSAALFDVISQTMIPPVLPTNPGDLVLATYRYVANEVPTNLYSRVFYRITTVAYNAESGDLVETPLDRAATSSNQEIEKLDWIWKEAIRRQNWMLFQGGERVKAFIRKIAGPKCGCNSSLYKQPDSTCTVCKGTGVLGGYDGPYDIIIAPDDGEKQIAQSNMGRSLVHAYDTWTGPSPLLSQRDFIVKQNGDRYGIGPVRMPSARGMLLQQFFEISHLDEPDIRYTVPVENPAFLKYPETRYIIQGRGDATPMITDNENIPAERQLRGKTVTWENENY